MEVGIDSDTEGQDGEVQGANPDNELVNDVFAMVNQILPRKEMAATWTDPEEVVEAQAYCQ